MGLDTLCGCLCKELSFKKNKINKNAKIVDGREGLKRERDVLISQTSSSHLTPMHFDTWLGSEALDKEL